MTPGVPWHSPCASPGRLGPSRASAAYMTGIDTDPAVRCGRGSPARDRDAASVRSRPSATRVSNSGGVAVRPVTATRIAMNRSPGFQPRASASARSGGSSSSASKVDLADGPIVDRARLQALARGRGIPPLRARASRASTGHLVDPQEADRSPIAPRRRQPLVDDRQQRPQLVVGRHAIDPARRELGLDERRRRSISSSGDSRRIHWPLSHSSRSRSNTAPPLWTCVELEALGDLVEREHLLLRARSPSPRSAR